jgi:FixJ family two-component response regulator
LERLKQLKSGLAVLMMSGSGLMAAVESLKRGTEDLIAKPCERATICKKINGILERQSPRGRAAQLG